MKEYFKNFFKSKFNIVLLVLLVITIVLCSLSGINKAFIFAGLICIALICFTVAVKMIVDYKRAGRKFDEAELHSRNAQEAGQVVRIRKNMKREVVFRVIMFIIFGILFLIATTKVY